MTLFAVDDNTIADLDTFFREKMSIYMNEFQFGSVKSMLLGGVETILISCPYKDSNGDSSRKEFPIYNVSKNSRSGSKGMLEIEDNGSIRSYVDSLVLTGNSVGMII